MSRGGLTESTHRGSISVVRSCQEILRLGHPERETFPRSALKPLQAVAVLEENLDRTLGLTPAQVILLSASHNAEQHHLAEIEDLLERTAIPPAALRCGTHPPLDRETARELVCSRTEPTVLHHNCSAKHAGMLILARHLGAPLESYLDPGHPAQQRIREVVADFAGVSTPSLGVGVDGCGAPAFSMPLSALALALRRLASPDDLPPARAAACRRLFDAAVEAPHFLSGRRRIDLAAMLAGDRRVFCKGGAEGVIALAVRGAAGSEDGIGVAIKIDDGALRGYLPPLRAVLEWLGFELATDAPELPPFGDAEIRSHAGAVVGGLAVGTELVAALEKAPDPWTS